MEKTGNVTSLDFERKIGELQKIVDRLESDADVSLEESMSLFEEGLGLTKDCIAGLNAMQARVSDLNKQLDCILQQPVFGEENE